MFLATPRGPHPALEAAAGREHELLAVGLWRAVGLCAAQSFAFDIGYRFRKRRYQHLCQPERSAASGEIVMAAAVNHEHHWRHGKVACSI
jgi:hypothetical protein